ncbi:MAG: SDR family oxidoreductase [Flavobacteriales bacterium]
MSTKKNILIVGASGYIAQEVLNTLGKSEEYHFILAKRKALGPHELRLDFSDVKSIDAFTLPKGISLDAIFFLQGINPSKNTKETSYEHFLSMLQVNIIGPALLIQKLHASIKKEALVLFFSSIAAQKGSYDPAYASAKAALGGLMNSLANEFNHIRFNSISLGLVENSPVDKGMSEDFRKRHKERMFNQQLIQVKDILATIELLLKNKSISATTIPLDGGYRV